MNVKIEGQQLSGGIERKANNRLWLVGILLLVIVAAVVSAMWRSGVGAPAASSSRDFLALNPEVRQFQRFEPSAVAPADAVHLEMNPELSLVQRYAAAHEADAATLFNIRNPEVRQFRRFMLPAAVHSARTLPSAVNPELRLVERYRGITGHHDREFLAVNPEVGAADRYREMKANE